MRQPNTQLVGCVGFFPERYGDKVLALALEILQYKSVSPAIYMPVQLITAHNVDRFYPKDIFEHAEMNEASF